VAHNIELKFMLDHHQRIDEIFNAFRFDTERCYKQEDLYLYGADCYFKLRIDDNNPSHILCYKRLTSPVLRESSYEKIELDHSTRSIVQYIFQHVKLAGTVKKKRRQIKGINVLINIDEVLADDWQSTLYSVVEIEYFANTDRALNGEGIVAELLRLMAVRPQQIMPYSNIHMVNMIKRSKIERQKYKDAKDAGRLVLIDGGSGTGKSTIKDILVKEYGLHYAKRDTTRPPRPDDYVTGDYNFASRGEFDTTAIDGAYIEFRDFLFGMSYGLPWYQFIDPLCRGSDVMALINLGNGYFTKRLFPEASLVLLHADIDVVRRRLESRGTATIEQLEERLENNRLAKTYVEAYDVNIDTSRHSAPETAEMIMGELRGHV
jgi:guanylate kinase/adenylate cyclase class IV